MAPVHVSPGRLIARLPAAATRPGLYVLGLGALSLSLHLWLARSLLLPLPDAAGIEYVFVSATLGTFATILVIVGAAVCAGHALLRRTARLDDQPPLFAMADVAYAWPLAGFAASAAALLALVPALADRLSVWLYLLIDLRWWWTALLLAWIAARVDARLAGALRRRARVRLPAVLQRRLPEAGLVALAVVWAVAGTPQVRFSADTHGDEPKYLRYCENFYQGRGFDISALRPVAELPAGFRPRVWRNVSMLATLLPRELRSLAGDIRAFLADPGRRFNRAQTRWKEGFLVGKEGGIYQLHAPGLSFVMFPAYYVDRRFVGAVPNGDEHWPSALPTVNGLLLALYATWTLLIFRFLTACVEKRAVAWITTAALVLTLPVAAFPFQFYPEIAAGALTFAVAGHVLFPSTGTARRSFVFGVLAGYLPWLHVRFSALAAVLILTAIVVLRRAPRRLLGFLGGTAVPLAALSLYAYRLTGSILPSAMYHAGTESSFFGWEAVARTSLAYLLDREWGLFAHSPIYLLALPGYWWMLRRLPAVAGLGALALAAVLLPSSGHSLLMGATTPLRTIVAVLPLAAVPLAELLARRGRSRLVQVTFGLLFVLSAHNALAYNLHHQKHIGPLTDSSASGWKVNLLLPENSRRAWQVSGANGALLVGWSVALIALVAAPALLRRPRERHGAEPATPLRASAGGPRLALVIVGLLGALGTAVSAATGTWTKAAFLTPPVEAAFRMAAMLDRIQHCAICATSNAGRIGTRTLLARLEAVGPDVVLRRAAIRPVAVEAVAGRPGAYLAYANDGAYRQGRFFWTRGLNPARLVVIPAGASHLTIALTCGSRGGIVRLRVNDEDLDRHMEPGAVHQVRVPLAPAQSLVALTVQASSAARPADVVPGSTDTRLLGCQVEVGLEP